MIRKELGDWHLMTREEAEDHRLQLMDARSASEEAQRERWDLITYSFCEHWRVNSVVCLKIVFRGVGHLLAVAFTRADMPSNTQDTCGDRCTRTCLLVSNEKESGAQSRSGLGAIFGGTDC